MNYRVPERIIEAQILKSKGKLTGIRFVGTIVLALILFSIPVCWIAVMVSMLKDHEPLEFGLLGSAAVIMGASLVAIGFGYVGYRLIRCIFNGTWRGYSLTL